MSGSPLRSGPISWMAQNPVAANLLMIVILVGGLIAVTQVKVETFPDFDLDLVSVTVPYPGASPEEVESGILLAIEEAVRGLDGVKRVNGYAHEGIGHIVVELLLGTNSNKALQDVKGAVDRLQTLPEEAERPVVSLLDPRKQVVSLVVFGEDIAPQTLRGFADSVRDELLQDPRIILVDLNNVPDPEIAIEVPQARLRKYNLTLGQIAETIRKNALELPGGGIKTKGGEVLLRTAERRELGQEFEGLRLLSAPDGTDVLLGDVGKVIDGFADTEQEAFYNGKPAIRVDVFRVGDQTPMGVADATKEHIERIRNRLPPGTGIALWRDDSEFLAGRINLLTRNAALGLILVVIVIGLFLEPRLAAWVTMGIPVSFCGALLVMPVVDASINMVSLMAFILTLGIVVDDAIIMGESIYEERNRGAKGIEAAIRGARLVSTPVTFSVLTNMIAFVPLLMIPGPIGGLFMVIPVVVLAVFFFSLLESLFILPAHLGHISAKKLPRVLAAIGRIQESFSRGLESFHNGYYVPSLRAALRHRYLTMGSGLSLLILTIGYMAGGHINFSFIPHIDFEIVTASASLPYGSPIEETRRIQSRMIEEARTILVDWNAENTSRGMFSRIGTPPDDFGPGGDPFVLLGAHLTSVQIYFVPNDQRQFESAEFAREWRARLQGLPGLESLRFKSSTGPSSASGIDIQLSHPDRNMLESAAARLAAGLSVYAGVGDINDGVQLGKPQLDFTIRPEGRSAGITADGLGRQLRDAFFGAEALRQQRGRDEIKVMVRLPEAERRSLHDIETMILQTPSGGEIALAEAAHVRFGRAYTEIKRANGRRIISVTADVDEQVANTGKILTDVTANLLPRVQAEFPGIMFGFEGEQREMRESTQSMQTGFILALVAIFATLAIPFRSYIQPLIVMTAIPFGIVGAVAGHVLMGFGISIISLMGIVALSGVVVNDSLVLIDAANQRLQNGATPFEAIFAAAVRRFRPILLTSLTTFFGLLPMMFETDAQARFLVPMAISLGFGILFATFIILMLVPALYLTLEDLRSRLGTTRTPAQAVTPGLD